MRNKLTARKVETLKKVGKYADGGGLYLSVTRPGYRLWTFRFMLDGRAREMSLGPVSDLSLAEARELAVRARAMTRDHVDPINAKQQAQRKALAAELRRMTFAEAV